MSQSVENGKDAEREAFADESPYSVKETRAVVDMHITASATFWSNVCFLIGGILYVCIDSWNLTQPGIKDGSPKMGSLLDSPHWDAYDVLSIMAPLMYVLNASIDISAACFARSKIWFGIASLFGLGAILDLVGTLVFDEVFAKSTSLPGTVAVHIYLLQAILALSLGAYHDYRNPTAAKLLKYGLTLFLVGSLIDVIISYFDMTKLPDEHIRVMEAFYLISSLLWFIDSILYILAEIAERRRGVHPTSNDDVDYDQKTDLVEMTPA